MLKDFGFTQTQPIGTQVLLQSLAWHGALEHLLFANSLLVGQTDIPAKVTLFHGEWFSFGYTPPTSSTKIMTCLLMLTLMHFAFIFILIRFDSIQPTISNPNPNPNPNSNPNSQPSTNRKEEKKERKGKGKKSKEGIHH